MALIAESPASMQALLDIAVQAIQDACMTINVDKTKAMCFANDGPALSKLRKACKLRIHGQAVEVVSEFKYLGETFTQDRKASKAMTQACSKAAAASAKVLRVGVRFGHMPVKLALRLFTAHVRSCTDYAACTRDTDAWRIQAGQLPQRYQTAEANSVTHKQEVACLRRILDVHSRAPVALVLGEAAVMPHRLHMHELTLRWYGSIMLSPADRIALCALQVEANLHQATGDWQHSWLGHVLRLLDLYGLQRYKPTQLLIQADPPRSEFAAGSRSTTLQLYYEAVRIAIQRACKAWYRSHTAGMQRRRYKGQALLMHWAGLSHMSACPLRGWAGVIRRRLRLACSQLASDTGRQRKPCAQLSRLMQQADIDAGNAGDGKQQPEAACEPAHQRKTHWITSVLCPMCTPVDVQMQYLQLSKHYHTLPHHIAEQYAETPWHFLMACTHPHMLAARQHSRSKLLQRCSNTWRRMQRLCSMHGADVEESLFAAVLGERVLARIVMHTPTQPQAGAAEPHAQPTAPVQPWPWREVICVKRRNKSTPVRLLQDTWPDDTSEDEVKAKQAELQRWSRLSDEWVVSMESCRRSVMGVGV
jgi:hypothetical protein